MGLRFGGLVFRGLEFVRVEGLEAFEVQGVWSGSSPFVSLYKVYGLALFFHCKGQTPMLGIG